MWDRLARQQLIRGTEYELPPRSACAMAELRALALSSSPRARYSAKPTYRAATAGTDNLRPSPDAGTHTGLIRQLRAIMTTTVLTCPLQVAASPPGVAIINAPAGFHAFEHPVHSPRWRRKTGPRIRYPAAHQPPRRGRRARGACRAHVLPSDRTCRCDLSFAPHIPQGSEQVTSC